MKKKTISRLVFLAAALTALLSFAGCELALNGTLEDEFDGDRRAGRPAVSNTAPAPFAGDESEVYLLTDTFGYQSFSYGLWAGQNLDAGTVTISNDAENFFVTVETFAALDEVHVYVYNSLEALPASRPAPGLAPYSAKNINGPSVTIEIPADDVTDGTAYYFIIHAALKAGDDPAFDYLAGETAYGAGSDAPSFSGRGAWFYGVTYVITEVVLEVIDDEVSIEPGDFRTQTQGGWGSPANSGPGSYLEANFDGAFPNGLTVGGEFTLAFTSTAAVREFLPAGGAPSALTESAVDPTSGNVFAGQVLALTLSVGFDLYDEDFGASDVNLKDLVFVDGTFEGWSVEAVLAEANKVLGGGSSEFSASELSDAVAAVNENFVDGASAGNALQLP